MLLNEMEIFYYVVELQSFSKAAERLNTSKSCISKRISRLEEELEVKLLSRSTRKLSVTEAGAAFHKHCAKIVTEGDKGYSVIQELQGQPSGTLKISVPPAVGMYLLKPVISQFLELYPQTNLHVELDDRVSDIIKEGYDLALRATHLSDSNLIAKHLLKCRSVVCASQLYLDKHGTPKTPEDLSKHNCAIYSHSKRATHLVFTKDKIQTDIVIQGKMTANLLELNKQMVLDKHCLAVLPEYMVAREIQTKALIPLLEEYQLAEFNIYAIYPERNFMPPKVKVFLELLQESLKEYHL